MYLGKSSRVTVSPLRTSVDCRVMATGRNGAEVIGGQVFILQVSERCRPKTNMNKIYLERSPPPQAICLKWIKEKCHIKIIFGSIVFVFLNVTHLVKANLSTMESSFFMRDQCSWICWSSLTTKLRPHKLFTKS